MRARRRIQTAEWPEFSLDVSGLSSGHFELKVES